MLASLLASSRSYFGLASLDRNGSQQESAVTPTDPSPIATTTTGSIGERDVLDSKQTAQLRRHVEEIKAAATGMSAENLLQILDWTVSWATKVSALVRDRVVPTQSDTPPSSDVRTPVSVCSVWFPSDMH